MTKSNLHVLQALTLVYFINEEILTSDHPQGQNSYTEQFIA